MGSCVTCSKRCPVPPLCRGDLDGEVLWFKANSPGSLEWQNKHGFGYRRTRTYREVAVGRKGYNREGNRSGELAGQIVFYQKADSDTDYGTFTESPVFPFKDGEKLFAKAFLHVPLGRIPVGVNNYKGDNPWGQGSTLLASRPRLVALYVTVDGQPQEKEHFCTYSRDDYNTRLEQFDVKPRAVTEALPGSFLTFMCSPDQDQYCFIHFPLVGSLGDTNFTTGVYGESLVRHFSDLLASLDPGTHEFEIKVNYAYDHCDYNCYVLGTGTNALGRWYKKISNNKINTPHEHPDQLETPDDPVACGSFTFDLDDIYQNTFVDQLDRKPPAEVYAKKDAEQLRRIAKTVAAGKFCNDYDVSGLPQWVVLTSDLTYHEVKDDARNGPHSYQTIDFVAMWVNTAEPLRPDAIGTMIEGSMGRGELLSGDVQEEFVFVDSSHTGISARRRWAIKNKYINAYLRVG